MAHNLNLNAGTTLSTPCQCTPTRPRIQHASLRLRGQKHSDPTANLNPPSPKSSGQPLPVSP
eukprot:1856194-Rhodomonas_salina.1